MISNITNSNDLESKNFNPYNALILSKNNFDNDKNTNIPQRINTEKFLNNKTIAAQSQNIIDTISLNENNNTDEKSSDCNIPATINSDKFLNNKTIDTQSQNINNTHKNIITLDEDNALLYENVISSLDKNNNADEDMTFLDLNTTFLDESNDTDENIISSDESNNIYENVLLLERMADADITFSDENSNITDTTSSDNNTDEFLNVENNYKSSIITKHALTLYTEMKLMEQILHQRQEALDRQCYMREMERIKKKLKEIRELAVKKLKKTQKLEKQKLEEKHAKEIGNLERLNKILILIKNRQYENIMPEKIQITIIEKNELEQKNQKNKIIIEQSKKIQALKIKKLQKIQELERKKLNAKHIDEVKNLLTDKALKETYKSSKEYRQLSKQYKKLEKKYLDKMVQTLKIEIDVNDYTSLKLFNLTLKNIKLMSCVYYNLKKYIIIEKAHSIYQQISDKMSSFRDSITEYLSKSKNSKK